MTGKLSPEQQEEFDRYATDALSKMRRKRVPVEDALREASIALMRAGRASPGEGIDSESAALNVLRQAIKDERDEAVQEVAEHHNKARAKIARLTAELAAARAEVDCGQDGPCAQAPGCARHWQERNRELVDELAAARAVPADVEAAPDIEQWLGGIVSRARRGCSDNGARADMMAEVASLRTAIARAISDATAARETVGGLLATAPVGAIVEFWHGATANQITTRVGGIDGRMWLWRYRNPNGEWSSWDYEAPSPDDLSQPGEIVPADPSQRGPLPKGG